MLIFTKSMWHTKQTGQQVKILCDTTVQCIRRRVWSGFLLVPLMQASQAQNGNTEYSHRVVCHYLNDHRHPSMGPADASILPSVSEASVCSVDMDDMSLMEDD